jgi:hypothetical protein
MRQYSLPAPVAPYRQYDRGEGAMTGMLIGLGVGALVLVAGVVLAVVKARK